MPSSRSQLERFVTALHRRHVFVWMAERAGMGIAAGGAFAVLLVVIALIFGRPAIGAVGASLVGGAVAGLVWGWITRPGVLRTVMEADRQLRLADLLSTAWAVRGSAGEPWRATVTHLADAACRAARPSEVLLRRWGARAWGAISLSTALLLVIAVLVERPSEGLAGVRKNHGEEGATTAAPPTSEHSTLMDIGPAAMTPRGPAHREPDDGNVDAGNSVNEDAKGSHDAVRQSNQGPQSANASAQAGSGFAQSKAPTQSLQLGSHGGARHENAGGATAAGGTVVHQPSRGADGNSTGAEAGDATGGRPNNAAPADWATGEARGWKAVEGRPEYQPYRELIQAYFERP